MVPAQQTAAQPQICLTIAAKMSEPHNRGKLVVSLLLCGIVAVLAVSFLNGYRVIRTERVCTRLAAGLADGQHEFVAALPRGRFQIQFTSEPNVSPSMIVPPGAVLPAQISTRIRGPDGGDLVEPTSKEYLTFSVQDKDAFRPLRISVGVRKTNECTIYMNMASGF
jgi:hypothetical protein